MSAKTIPAETYLAQIMGDKDFITSQDLPLENDTDYVMSIMIPMECVGNDSSSFKIEFMDGETSKNGYTIPNMRISRKEQL